MTEVLGALWQHLGNKTKPPAPFPKREGGENHKILSPLPASGRGVGGVRSVGRASAKIGQPITSPADRPTGPAPTTCTRAAGGKASMRVEAAVSTVSATLHATPRQLPQTRARA